MKHTFSACCCAILISISAQAQKGASHFEIDTRAPLQTIDGFGASDAWSMQHIGLWPDSVRLQTADWLFSTENDSKGQPLGIGLSIWRFRQSRPGTRKRHRLALDAHGMLPPAGRHVRLDATARTTQLPAHGPRTGRKDLHRLFQFASRVLYPKRTGYQHRTGRDAEPENGTLRRFCPIRSQCGGRVGTA